MSSASASVMVVLLVADRCFALRWILVLVHKMHGRFFSGSRQISPA